MNECGTDLKISQTKIESSLFKFQRRVFIGLVFQSLIYSLFVAKAKENINLRAEKRTWNFKCMMLPTKYNFLNKYLAPSLPVV